MLAELVTPARAPGRVLTRPMWPTWHSSSRPEDAAESTLHCVSLPLNAWLKTVPTLSSIPPLHSFTVIRFPTGHLDCLALRLRCSEQWLWSSDSKVFFFFLVKETPCVFYGIFCFTFLAATLFSCVLLLQMRKLLNKGLLKSIIFFCLNNQPCWAS